MSAKRKRIRPQKKFSGQDANKSILLENGKIRERADNGISGFTQSARISPEVFKELAPSAVFKGEVKDGKAETVKVQHSAELAYEGFKRMLSVAFQDNRSGRHRLKCFMEQTGIALTPLPGLTEYVPCEGKIAPTRPPGMTDAEYDKVYSDWLSRIPCSVIRYLSVDNKLSDKDISFLRTTDAFIGIYDFLVPVGGNTGAAETWNRIVFQVDYRLSGEKLTKTFSNEEKATAFSKEMKGTVSRKTIQVRPQRPKDERYQTEAHRQADKHFNENTAKPSKERGTHKLNYNRLVNSTKHADSFIRHDTKESPDRSNGGHNAYINWQEYRKGESQYDK